MANGLVSVAYKPSLLTTIAALPQLAQNRAPSIRSPPHRLQILSVMFFSFQFAGALRPESLSVMESSSSIFRDNDLPQTSTSPS